MNKEDKVVEICDSTRLANGNKVNWYDATQLLNEVFECEKSWKAWRSIYRRKKGTHKPINVQSNEQATKGKYVITEVIKEKPKKIEIEVGANGTQHSTILVNILEYPLKTPKDILELHGYDLAQWELVNHKLKIWNTYSKQDGTSELYSSALTVKPKQNILTSDFLAETFAEKVKNYIVDNKRFELKPLSNDQDGYMLELGLYDVHFGKFAWHKETNNDFDLKIAEILYRQVLDDLLYQSCKYNIKKILIIFGNDFFHYDNMKIETAGGTPQDTDTRLPKMYSKGLDMIFETVNKCLEIAPTEFIYVPSNHDYTMGYFASETIYRAYKEFDTFNYINVSPLSRKYYLFGNVLLGFTHGDKENKENMLTLMQDEQPELWYKSQIREWHLGHRHSEWSQQYNGFLMRGFPSITATDLWHFQKGWEGAVRKGQAFIWHESGSKIIVESIVKKELK